MGERKICLTAAYDGTCFYGWQVQAAGRTVQGVMEEALEQMHRRPVRLTGAGRTDSGVHARGQRAHFTTDIASMEPQQFVPALNSLLPRDVRVTDAREVPPNFHARYDAVSREYRYLLHWGSQNPMNSGVMQISQIPDIPLLNAYARCIIGIHDFTSFCSSGDASASRIRNITDAVWYARGSDAVFLIRGNAFLWKMVRSLVGTMLELEQACAPASEMKGILEARDRERSGTVARSSGLHLWRVEYA